MARRSLDLATDRGLKLRRILPLRVLAESAIRAGDFPAAIEAASEAANSMEELGASPLPARMLECEAYIADAPTLGDIDRFEEVIADIEQTDRAALAFDARVDLAFACAQLGLTERAMTALPRNAFTGGPLRTQATA